MKSKTRHLALIFFLLSAVLTVNAVTYTWNGGTSTSWAVAANWTPTRTTPATSDDIVITPSSGATISITSVPAQTINSLTINGTGTVTMSGGTSILTITNSLAVNSGNTLDVSTIRLAGITTISGTGVLKTGNSVPFPTGKTYTFDVVLNGSATQSVNGTFNNLTIDNSTSINSVAVWAGGGDITVSGTLTLSRGILAGNASMDLMTGTPRNIIMNAGSTIVGGSSSSYILAAGPVGSAYFRRKSVGTTSLLYPIGTAAGYTPLTIKNNSGNPDITVKLKRTLTNPSADVTKVVNLEWSVTSSVATTADITFQFNGSNMGSQYDVTSTNDLGNYKSSTYSSTSVGTATSLGNNNYSVSATGLSLPINTASYYYVANSSILSSMAAPGAPTIGAATTGPSGTQASVTFTPPTTGGSVTYYTVTSNPGAKTGGGTSSPIVVTGLTNGTAYTFTVTATNGVGTSTASGASASITTSAVTTPLQPTNIVATPGNGQVTLTFTAPSGTITNYKYSLDGGYTFTSAGVATSPINITGLTNGTIYNLALLAVNASGDGQAVNAGVVTPSTTPAAPSITGITAGNGQLSVVFTAGSSNGAAILNYKYSTNGGSTFTACSPAQLTSPIVITGLTNGTSYNVQIIAVNAKGDGTATASTAATPKGTQTITWSQDFSNVSKYDELDLTASSDGDGAITYSFVPLNSSPEGGILIAGAHAKWMLLGEYTLTATAAATATYNSATLDKTVIIDQTTKISNVVESNNLIVSGKSITMSEVGAIQILNAQGALIYQAKGVAKVNTNLQSGMYVVRFINLKGLTTVKKIAIR
ncbi:MAG: beta strand repeat-containing protein [Bacteroidales bacterium]